MVYVVWTYCRCRHDRTKLNRPAVIAKGSRGRSRSRRRRLLTNPNLALLHIRTFLPRACAATTPMPPRPFPVPLSIGTDIVHVKRIHSILLRAQGKPETRDRFLRRFLTPGEVHEFQIRFSDASKGKGAQLDLISKHLAGRCDYPTTLPRCIANDVCYGRWAAKEAAIKAVTWRRLSFHDVVIQRVRHEGPLQAVIVDHASTAPPFEASGPREGWSPGNDGGAARSVEHSAAQLVHGSQGDTLTKIEGQVARISISHDGEYATAVCLAAGDPTTSASARWSTQRVG